MKSYGNILVIIICFLLYYAASTQLGKLMLLVDQLVHYRLVSLFVAYIIVGIPIFLGTYIVNKRTNIFASLGLNGNILFALMLTVLFTLPMFVGGFILYPIIEQISIPTVIAKTLFAGFFEELYFRGFLFGMLFRYAKLGFIPAVLLGAIVFALGHLYQSHDVDVQVGIFLVTFMGSGFFAWLYAEWKYNLWVPILLHTFMNLSWLLYDFAANAAGSVTANIFRVLTIALSIIFTIIYKQKKGYKLTVNKHTLWMKR